MNLLLLVFSFLLILSGYTTQQLSLYRTAHAIHGELHSAAKQSREGRNEKQKRKYQDKKSSEKKGKKAKGTGFIPLVRLYDGAAGGQLQMEQLLRRVIQEVYAKEDFYTKALEKHPQFLEEIIEGLKKNQGVCGKRFRKESDLKKLPLESEIARKAYTDMLEGSRPQGGGRGYPSLLDFVTVPPQNNLIRIYLAKKPLLIALFNTEAQANAVEAKRRELYQQVKEEHLTPEEASKEFEELFAGSLSIDPVFVNFAVTKTSPPRG